ncbi:MAG: UDP-N-acetylglucosamine pyrophosphorylase [Deltaproteobacteria bacterium]|nr:UDP-N-acetylglucosamine pyrophosphorylase [Deltaproteobacteria bacterium]
MSESYTVPDKVIALMKKGVRIPNPCCVEIGEDVRLERISGKGVVLHSGTKLCGAETLICDGTELGYEAPVTVVDCQIGRGVKLHGGFFKRSVFLDGVEMAYGAHVREGCILEEEARAAHTVGLKQTILFPFVTLGSLINFCDCLMSGGTDGKNHSEVGSSYIHFNYTPNQDKATASLIGDVPTGVMLNQPPIFLGGQGGLVGPVRIGHGTVIAAGSVYRNDCPEGGKLLTGGAGAGAQKDFYRGLYCNVGRKVRNNIYYIANLIALKQWYLHVRLPYFKAWEFGPELCEGAIEKLDMAIGERVKRLKAFSGNMAESTRIARDIENMRKTDMDLRLEEEVSLSWPRIEEYLRYKAENDALKYNPDDFLVRLKIHSWGKRKELWKEGGYVRIIHPLDKKTKALGTAWLQGIVDLITQEVFKIIPPLKQ